MPSRVTEAARLSIRIEGAVQGVGFRPFVHSLATGLGVDGFVTNDTRGVVIDVQGESAAVQRFVRELRASGPPSALVTGFFETALEPQFGPGFAPGFTIRPSVEGPAGAPPVGPDLATCPACLAELRDSADRRYRYPFLNCTACGPRYSILHELPYDRARTTMAGFEMCPACRAEYEDPLDRRFHAQPTACPECGPQLELLGATGERVAERESALAAGIEVLRRGGVLAVKGIGGFHLCVDARSTLAVDKLRRRKGRPRKPLAVMFRGIEGVEAVASCCATARSLLTSPAAPIVLVPKRADAVRPLALNVAPGAPDLGCFLSYSPLHHVLLGDFGGPLVATSGNRSDEPIAIDNNEAVRRLAGLADAFLVHDRAIARPVDDSVLRVVDGEPLYLRRSRGFAPLALSVAMPESSSELPVACAHGGHQKNTVAFLRAGKVVLSQHIGDFGLRAGLEFHQSVQADMQRLFRFEPTVAACDAHADYGSTLAAEASGLPVARVPHHLAHVLATLVDHGLGDVRRPILGVAWDGTGFGPADAARPPADIWGGEWLEVGAGAWARCARLEPFALPGGEAAIREPRRSAVGLLTAVLGPDWMQAESARCLLRSGAFLESAFEAGECERFTKIAERLALAPMTSSMGRLFDAVASLLCLAPRASFEAEAAMALEAAAQSAPCKETARAYPIELTDASVRELRLEPIVFGILEDLAASVERNTIAARFHATLAGALVLAAEQAGREVVALSGGCFQNALLLSHARRALSAAGFEVLAPRSLPPGDGALAAGQALAAALHFCHVPRPI